MKAMISGGLASRKTNIDSKWMPDLRVLEALLAAWIGLTEVIERLSELTVAGEQAAAGTEMS
jgi:hypothetical protein